MKFKSILVGSMAAVLVACSTVGNKYDVAAVSQLKPGVSTMDEAVSLLGEPTTRFTNSDGATLLQWQFSKAVYTSVRGTHHAILFDQNGVMLRKMMDGTTNIN